VATSIEHVFAGVARVRLPLPTGPGHVHAYLLDGVDGLTVVDTGLGLPDAAERWREVLADAGEPVARIVVTHFHPDHLGAARDLAELTGAPVLQSRVDAEQTRRVWADATWPERLAGWFERHGMPRPEARTVVDEGRLYMPFIRYAPEAQALGDEVAGWHVVPTPGHADGHVCLLREGVLVAGDHLLADISPAIGLYPDGAPDPLGAYLASLAAVERLAPRVALPGHGPTVDDPAARARELRRHHAERLDACAAALDGRPRSAHDVSLELFPGDLDAGARRFALAETLAHLERLAAEGGARRARNGRDPAYTAP
jgi:glyoxylase-like metal-dependent hydrolase (beta-lactamase superfamily II)